jgi:hypothetical protein
VKAIQRLVLVDLQKIFPVHSAAHAYVKGRGIRTNAMRHVHGSFIAKFDFSNFFPSIGPPDLITHIERRAMGRFTAAEIDQLCRIIFWQPKGTKIPRLSIGAPSSPFVSNAIVYDIDIALDQIARNVNAQYTRYADDLTFSTTRAHVLDRLPILVRDVLRGAEYPRLTLNDAKTVFASKKGRREVTGLVINSNNQISLGRTRKRTIRSMAHKRSLGQLDANGQKQLNGLLAFANDIEPSFVRSLRDIYAV